ncbi:hypothetical protein M1M34_gp103 [Haloarcula tailed virus 2]|uniref:Uncharacterized protein n=1 Tax=Haloarcula tailed virus 2 TaxID=2877989 RepID=A0AAE9BY55_9CAUD|nr:hypothetical protein M1M34_gp103 [Haloarcula tailed virus 2]UBF23230.1 hypothetical protein HATV-2_gp79 [Haloarcula tailed virus 2]
MSTQESEVEAAQDENEEQAWINQKPTTEISGVFKDIIYSGELSERAAQNGTSFGILFEDVEVENGELFRNQNKEDGAFVVVDEETGKRATDYRVVDLDDDKLNTAEVNGETFVTDRAGQTFEAGSIDSSDEDVIVWYNGMAGQVIARALDMNGRPFAEYKEDGYLVKGLLQVAEGWRDGNKGAMVKSGLGPRVARAPIPRDDHVDTRISIEIGRWNGGNMYEATVTDAEGDEIEMQYNGDADDVLDAHEYGMHLHHGDGWQDEPANAQKPARQFTGITADAVESEDGEGFSPVQQNFISSVTDAVIETGLRNADDAFVNGVAGLMDQHGVTGDTAALTEEINNNVLAHYGELEDEQ